MELQVWHPYGGVIVLYVLSFISLLFPRYFLLFCGYNNHFVFRVSSGEVSRSRSSIVAYGTESASSSGSTETDASTAVSRNAFKLACPEIVSVPLCSHLHKRIKLYVDKINERICYCYVSKWIDRQIIHQFLISECDILLESSQLKNFQCTKVMFYHITPIS